MPIYPPITALAPLILLLAALIMLSQPGRRPGLARWLPESAALIAFAFTLGSLAQLVMVGPTHLRLFSGLFALVLQQDAISATMTLLVGFIGWIVMRYSRTYLDGEAHEGKFHALMLSTLAAVLLLMQSGSFLLLILAFIGVGFGLRQLLLFYAERAAARRAAIKFRLVWHTGDAALGLAAIFLFIAIGTTEFAVLSEASANGLPLFGQVTVALIVLAAALKTASFPLHGWLTEVMEAPTPVSALLHAGIINAGGFLLIRTADVVQASPGAMAGLVMLGGLTALFGAVVMLTQNAIKTSLAWSTIAQMGFMLLQCGLGLWPLAMLHIVAHSMYKAHAFLSSGGAVAHVASVHRPGPVAVPSVRAVLHAFAMALVLYAVIAIMFSWLAAPKNAQTLALGTMLIFGVAYLVAQGLADAAPAALTKRTAQASICATAAYFSFQLLAGALWGPYLPAAPTVGPLEWALIVLAVFSFGLVAFAQTLFPLWAHHSSTAGLRVHIANGLYLNALLDRLIGGFRVSKSN